MQKRTHDNHWIGRMYQRSTIAVTTSNLYIGRCHTCNAPRYESECRQVERDECCLYACRVCDSTIDESVAPF